VEERDPREATRSLIARLHESVALLRAEQSATLPSEPYLESDSAVKGGLKRTVFRATRPATRRYDRLATELVTVAVELAEQLQAANDDIDQMHGDIDRLDHAVGSLRSAVSKTTEASGPHGLDRGVEIPDRFYWAFEERMRGSSASVLERMRRYESFAVPLREGARFGDDVDGERALWLDLGCGLGEFCALVREWGWDVEGVDRSPEAVEATRAKDIEATLAEAGSFLESRRGPAPLAISAIQVIEHLDRSEWIELFERVFSSLRPGGAFLLETINGLNPQAVMSYFLADLTHTWPGHPETLSLMAEYVGFEPVEIHFLNPDERGNAQDFAIWARKPAEPDREPD
jgi:SAM-dependent methyltransferase